LIQGGQPHRPSADVRWALRLEPTRPLLATPRGSKPRAEANKTVEGTPVIGVGSGPVCGLRSCPGPKRVRSGAAANEMRRSQTPDRLDWKDPQRDPRAARNGGSGRFRKVSTNRQCTPPLARTVSIRASPLPLAYRLTMPTGASLLPGPRAALHLRLSPRDSHQTESKQRHALQRLFERKGGYLRRWVRRPRARAQKLFALWLQRED
jgi:hypothetical protein